MYYISKFIFFTLLGWKIEGSIPDIKKMVIMVIPHTSWHDFYVGVFVRGVSRIEINFIGKKEIFKWPFGDYFRWMGGAHIDRTPGQEKVKSIADNVHLRFKQEAGWLPSHFEGQQNANWICLDYFDVVVHVFYREARSFYELEDLWSDATFTEYDSL